MKNRISILILLVAIAIPQVASAAWWNPFSWKVFERIFAPKTEVFEAEKEIAKESIEDVAITNKESELEKLRAEVEELKNQKTSDTTKTPQTSSPTQTTNNKVNTTIVSPPIPQIKATFEDILKKYSDFQSTITKEEGGLKINSPYSSERQYLDYLNNLLTKITADIGYLTSVKSWNPRPAGIEELYLSKFDKLKNEYDVQARSYSVDIANEKESLTTQKQGEIKETETSEKNSAYLAKQERLKEVNQKIVTLNAKYAQDLKDLQSGGMTTAGYNATLQSINTKYTIDYNILQAEWQQIYYSN